MTHSNSDPVQEAFGTTLRRHRHALGISQEELAHRAGLTMRYISMMETGRRIPTIAAVFALTEGLGVSASEFVAEIEATLKT